MKTPHTRQRHPLAVAAKSSPHPQRRLPALAAPHANGHKHPTAAAPTPAAAGIAKCPTGIRGLDDLTLGGIPRGRSTLVCGGAGSGKTLLATEFIIRGARDFHEPGVILSFDETAQELTENLASLNFDLTSLLRRKQVSIDHVQIDRTEINSTGGYNLDGLFIRLGYAIDTIGAKRVMIDGVDSLFAGFPDENRVRTELHRLFEWLKKKRVTALITGEQGDRPLTRHGLEEYISDCVIFLDHRVINQVSTRRLRIVKYRGSVHGTNEYPAMIDADGISVLPISSLGLNYSVSNKRVSTGIPRLDTMLGGKGFYRGSSILISGTSGTGKTSLAAILARSICQQGERCLYLPMEESPSQLTRNMASIGVDLASPTSAGLLRLHSIRPTLYGLEGHLLNLHRLVTEFHPSVLVIDPISNLAAIGNTLEIKAMFTRLTDFLKHQGVTIVFTSLTGSDAPMESSAVGISSLIDSWILLRMVQTASERNRLLYVLKSRGMAHSNQIREFNLTDRGIELLDVYAGPGIEYTGSGRLTQKALDRATTLAARQAAEQRERELGLEQRSLQAQIDTLQTRLTGIEAEKSFASARTRLLAETAQTDKVRMSLARKAD